MLSTALASPAATAATHYPGPWGAGFGWVFFLIPLFWILVIATLFAIFGRRRRAWASDQRQSAARSAESTLAERFAQGDIDEVEYRARLEVLRANRPAA